MYTITMNCGGKISEVKCEDIAEGIEKIVPNLILHSGNLSITNGEKTFGRILPVRMVRQLKNKIWRLKYAHILKSGLGE